MSLIVYEFKYSMKNWDIFNINIYILYNIVYNLNDFNNSSVNSLMFMIVITTINDYKRYCYVINCIIFQLLLLLIYLYIYIYISSRWELFLIINK